MTEDVKQDKQDAPPCGLYLRIPENPDMDLWQPRIIAFSHVIKSNTTYRLNMHVIELTLSDNPTQEAVEKAAAFIQIAQINGLVAILNGPLKFATVLEADGILLNDIKDIQPAKQALPEDKIIGLFCAMDADLATKALAQSVDYITLGTPLAAPTAKLVSQITTTTQKPITALGPLTNQTAAIYTLAGATFLDTTHYLSTTKKGPMQATVNMLYEIDTAAGSVKIN